MKHEPATAEHLFCLPPGTRVREWLLLGCHGHGAYGVVYRAVRVGQEPAEPVALKLSLCPWEPRSMREVGLLKLLEHPSLPRLLDHGFWQDPEGLFFPFIVMEWVEGLPLYEWAREHPPSNLQVFQVLAQLARALAATHACHAVHRDVKGDNILVRRSDGRAMLMDFGAGHYPCAARLTWQPLPPGTAPYRAPEAWLFERRAVPSQGDCYVASPADDVYALGVTAYHLVTGEYPRGPRLQLNAEGTWHLREAHPLSPRELNPRVEPQLSALILRMLSLSPEARGTAAELAEALEAHATHAAKGAGAALPVTQPLPSRLRARKPRMAWRLLSPWVLAGVFLALWLWQALPVASTPAPADEATTRLGESGAQAPVPPEKEPSKQKAVAQDEPPKPFPGQQTPDARGRCPGRKQLPINVGCWVEVPAKNAEECVENGSVFFKARCYAPALDTRRKPPPTSAPSDSR